MAEINIEYCFGFGRPDCGYDYAEDVEISDELYEHLQSAYQEYGEAELTAITDDEDITAEWPYELKEELDIIINKLTDELIDCQRSDGNHIDPDTGEEYDFDNMFVRISVETPDEWEE